MADTLGSINNLLRRTKYTTQDELNAIRHAFLEQQEEQKGFDRKARVTKSREKINLTENWTAGNPDVDISESLKVRNGNFIIQSDISTHSAYPVTHTETGTIDYSVTNGTKYGASARFTGSQYVTIPNHADLNITIPCSFSFMYKFTETVGGSLTLFCKKDESEDYDEDFHSTDFHATDFATTPAPNISEGIHIWIETTQTASFGSDFNSDFQKAAVSATINVRIGDGSNSVTCTQNSSDLFDGNWHSIIVNIGDLGNDFHSTDFNSDFSTTASEVISIYQDNTLLGTTSHTSLSSIITNTRNAYFGARDNGGTLDQKLKGAVAWFFWGNAEQTSTDRTDYENGKYHSHIEKSAISFEGNSENTTLDNY